MILIIFRCFFVFSSLTVSLLWAQKPEQIIEMHLEKTGGKNHWNNIKTLKTKGRVLIKGETLDFILYQKRPNKSRSVVTKEGRQIITLYNGKQAWQIDSIKLKKNEITGKSLKDIAENAIIEPLFINAKTKGFVVKFMGIKNIDKNPTYIIELVSNDEKKIGYQYFFDKKTYYLKAECKLINNGEQCTYYNDFKKISGLILPHKITENPNGEHTVTYLVDSLELNPTLQDSDFELRLKELSAL